MVTYDPELLKAISQHVADQIASVRAETGIQQDYKAFGYWYLTEFEELSAEEALNAMTDGAWDQGRDAVYVDPEASVLTIYQFKYSSDTGYVSQAFTDVQRGLQAELPTLLAATEDGAFAVEAVRCVIVSMTAEDSSLESERLRVLEETQAWLQTIGRGDVQSDLEHNDAIRFAQAMGKIVGVDLRLNFSQQPLELDGGLLGLIDARDLVPYIGREELLSLNIRRYLGLGGSVNKKINESVKKPADRDQLWKLNNGLVCVCTGFTPAGETSLEFTGLTIVNGAQTSTTVAKYLDANPHVFKQGPVWLVAKILVLESDELLRALRFTVTSNTQNAAGDRDIRGSEQLHEYLAAWLNSFGKLVYVHKRSAGRPPKGAVSMKDLAQAYIAWMGYPDVSFSRSGQIFRFDNEPDYYSIVFPEQEIIRLEIANKPAERDAFLLPRLVAWRTLVLVRDMLRDMVKAGVVDKSWNSIAYHLVWLYGQAIEKAAESHEDLRDPLFVYENLERLVVATAKELFTKVYDQVVAINAIADEADRYVIPRDLKSTKFTSRFLEAGFKKTLAYDGLVNRLATLAKGEV